MKFVNKLKTYIGRNVEIGMSNGHIITGVLFSVNFSFVVVLGPGLPGYDGGEEEVLIRTGDIEYVRAL